MVEALCPICQRDVYLGEEDELTCPVCSTPLIELENPESDSVA